MSQESPVPGHAQQSSIAVCSVEGNACIETLGSIALLRKDSLEFVVDLL